MRVQSRRFYSRHPAILRRVIFVDWHGVLSDRTFWETIEHATRHPYLPAVQQLRRKIFEEDLDALAAWMRGRISTTEVVRSAQLVEVSDRRFEPDFLTRRLVEECGRTPLNGPLVETLKELLPSWQIVVATDNMDFFRDAAWARRDIQSFVDDIISSASVGVLKSEDPRRFFGSWMADRSISPQNAILIDDSPANCDAFERIGGKAILVGSYKDAGLAARQLVDQEHRLLAI